VLLDIYSETLALPRKSKVLNQKYLDFLTGRFKLIHNGFHGLEHWLRVLINGRLIAAECGADIEVVEHFALIHDAMRQTEDEDMYHGSRAASNVHALAGNLIDLDRNQLDQLIEACRYHSMGRLSHDITVQACWDADRLDLGRVGTKPNPTYLGTKIARNTAFLEAAQKRSMKRFVNYEFSKMREAVK